MTRTATYDQRGFVGEQTIQHYFSLFTKHVSYIWAVTLIGLSGWRYFLDTDGVCPFEIVFGEYAAFRATVPRVANKQRPEILSRQETHAPSDRTHPLAPDARDADTSIADISDTEGPASKDEAEIPLWIGRVTAYAVHDYTGCCARLHRIFLQRPFGRLSTVP